MTPWDRKSKSRINSRTFSRPICPYFLSVCFCPPQDKVGQNCCQYKASLDLPLIDLFFNLLSVCFLSTWRKSLSELLSIQGFARPPSLPARPYPVLALNITLTRNFVGIVNTGLTLIFFSFHLFHLLTVLSVSHYPPQAKFVRIVNTRLCCISHALLGFLIFYLITFPKSVFAIIHLSTNGVKIVNTRFCWIFSCFIT